MLDYQIEMETLFSKNQLIPRIRKEFQEAKFDFTQHMTAHRIDPEFGYSLLVQMVLHKRAYLPVLVGILKRHCDHDCQQTAIELLKACQADLVDWNPVTKQFIVRYDISPDVQADLDRYQFPLPLVVEPKELKKNTDSGYYTHNGSVILRDNHHDGDVCLDHLNRVNKTRFRLNQEVARKIKNSWRNLDKPKPDEDHKDYQKRVKAFEKYDRVTHDVIDTLGLSNGGEFWLTHRYDKRGRTYCVGYHVNYQSAPWNKAVVHFAEEEVVEG